MVLHPLFKIPGGIILSAYPVSQVVLDLPYPFLCLRRILRLCSGLATRDEEKQKQY